VAPRKSGRRLNERGAGKKGEFSAQSRKITPRTQGYTVQRGKSLCVAGGLISKQRLGGKKERRKKNSWEKGINQKKSSGS